MKRFALAIVALVLCVAFADAAGVRSRVVVERNRFPVATAVGRGINRVVGFPFRVAAAAVGFQPRSRVIVNTGRANVVVNRQRVVVDVRGRQAFRAQQIVIRRPVAVQRVVVQRNFVHRDRVIFRQVANYSYPQQVVVQRIVAQEYAAPETVEQEVVEKPVEKVILREVAQPTYTQRVILRETAGHGCVSQVRVTAPLRLRSAFRY